MHSKQQPQRIWRLQLNEWPQEYKKRIWPTFGSKSWSKCPKCNESRIYQASNRYLKRCGITAPKSKKKRSPKTFRNNRPNSENKIFAKNEIHVEICMEGYLCTKFERFIFIYEAMVAKNGFDLLLAVKVNQSDPIWMNSKLTMSDHLPKVFTKFQTDSRLKKSGKLGWTDGRTLPRHNTTVFTRAYKNYKNVHQDEHMPGA